MKLTDREMFTAVLNREYIRRKSFSPDMCLRLYGFDNVIEFVKIVNHSATEIYRLTNNDWNENDWEIVELN